MPVTSAQYKFLRKPLLDLGYQIDDNSAGTHVVTNYRGRPFLVGLDTDQQPFDTHVMYKYDWGLFLAIAAATDGNQFIAGEYGVAVMDFAPVVKEDGTYRFYDARGEQVEIFGVGWHPSKIFRKPTKSELITYFNYDPYESQSRRCKRGI